MASWRGAVLAMVWVGCQRRDMVTRRRARAGMLAPATIHSHTPPTFTHGVDHFELQEIQDCDGAEFIASHQSSEGEVRGHTTAREGTRPVRCIGVSASELGC